MKKQSILFDVILLYNEKNIVLIAKGCEKVLMMKFVIGCCLESLVFLVLFLVFAEARKRD